MKSTDHKMFSSGTPPQHIDVSKDKETVRASTKVATIPSSKGLSRFELPSQYEVKSIIGTGSYGSVCEAVDHKRQDLVAVKRMGHLFKDLVDCKRILREVAILSKLKHESIVHMYDIPTPANPSSFQELYIVMEVCDSDMKKLVRTNVTLSPLHINTLLYNLLLGIKYLHSAGIYHRDLKPANCLVNQNCSVKICDFGLSRAIGEMNSQDLPESPRDSGKTEGMSNHSEPQPFKRHLTGHVQTRWYRAPELILLQDHYTEAIDMWSTGCIYAELLGMLEGTEFEDRGPLFPGHSCFPLSPDRQHKNDYKYHTRGNHDQLSMIFSLLGTPSEEQLAELNFSRDAFRYIRCFSQRSGDGLRWKFPRASDASCDILEGMLRLNPRHRITVDEALEHSVFNEDTLHETPAIRDKSRETTAAGPITLDFEQEPDLDETKLRHYFMREILLLQAANEQCEQTL